MQQAVEAAIHAHQAGNLETAERAYRSLLRRHPGHPLVLHLLGLVLLDRGCWPEAERAIQAALMADNSEPQFHNSLGEVYRSQARYDEAICCYEQALRLDAACLEAWGNLGLVLQERGRQAEARACYESVLRLAPGMPIALNNLALLDQEAEKHSAAIARLEQAIQAAPESAEFRNNLGISLRKTGQRSRAHDAFAQALALAPDYTDAAFNLGRLFLESGRLDEARHWLRQVTGISTPISSELHAALPQACALDAHRALLMCQLYAQDSDAEQSFSEHRAFAAKWGAGKRTAPRFDQPHDWARPLRIGYVSSDLHDHPVARNMMPIIRSHDRRRFEIVFYAHDEQRDAVTDWFKANANAYRSISQLDDAQVAGLMRQDRIDIAVFLAGRFDNNRPLIACHRAAPVQVSWHDPATSGLEDMDYLITDITLSPRDAQERFTEKLVRLPTYYLHDPIVDAPGSVPPPSIASGQVTFGSFNNPAKLTPAVIALWCRVLDSVPGSRLLLKYKDLFGDEFIRDRYQALFRAQGVSEDRLTLASADEQTRGHLANYEQVDIALDPFPFNGSTTTFEALWMGVPVIALAGNFMVSRWSASMLRRVGLSHWVAHSEDEYVSLARELAAQPVLLSDLRVNLRERVRVSPLCDAMRRTRQIERAYQYMWRKWCLDQAESNAAR